MKKIIVAILAVLYLGVSSGATVSLHYCMGKLVSWDLSGDRGDKCPDCGMKKNGKNCCNEEHKLIKISDDQKASDIAYQIAQFSAVVNHYYPELPQLQVVSLALQNPLTHAPPRSGKVALYLRNCTFLI